MWQTIVDVFERNRLALLAGGGVVLLLTTVVVVILLASRGEDDDAQPAATGTVVVTEVAVPSETGTPIAGTVEATETAEPSATATAVPTAGGPPPTSPPQATATPMPTDTPLPQKTDVPEPFSITILSPEPGEIVTPVFTIQIAVAGIELDLGPGGQLIPGAGHWHIALDTAPPLPEQHDEPAVQFGPVEAGLHTITVLLNLNDADLTVVAIDQVQITVTD